MTTVSIAKPYKTAEIKKNLHPLIREWFFSKFKDFSEAQKFGVMNVFKKKNTLISAPTGGGKTLTAFLSILNELVELAEKNKLDKKVYAIYASPLKALTNDIHKNLIEPLEEIKALAESKGIKLQEIRVALRTGDTTQSEKAKMARNPPHILVTTPESLSIILTTKKFVESFDEVQYCIVDEIHSLGNKRGVNLSISLERLNDLTKKFPTKIGLSATVEPLEEVARFLVGEDKNREIEIAKVKSNKKLDIDILLPVKDLVNHPNPHLYTYNLISELIQKHETTLIFTNTRAATERVVNYLKDKFPTDYTDENIAAHHSSLSKDHRFQIEEDLRNGKLKVVVCSTSLELGIDIGFIDLVILMGSPKASSRALQRIGRAGHQLHETAKGRFIVMDRDDLVECAVIQKEMIEGKIDNIQFPKNALDVLSQQIYAMAISKIWKMPDMLKTIRKSHCYKDLSKKDFLSVISYLSGEYDLEKSHVYGKIWYDQEENTLGKKGKLARVIYMTNMGTIPEESFITVKMAGGSGEKIGVIDESFLSRMKKSDVFVLGGKKYSYQYTKGMNLYVKPSPTRSPTIPSWFSETLPLSFESALEINRFREKMLELFSENKTKTQIKDFIKKQVYVNNDVADEIYQYFYEQYHFSEIPHTGKILIERYIDERDEKKFLLVNSMYGRRVNDALSRALAYLIGSGQKRDVEIGISDRGFYLSSDNLNIEKAFEKLNSENLEDVLKEAIEKTDILTRRFRHCASRSLMILRSYKGNQKSVRKQQMKSHFLISAVKKISSEFPILNEAKREVLEDLMDLASARKVLDWIHSGEIELSYNVVKVPSPFSLNLLLQGHLDLMRMEDKQDFLKRMHTYYMQEIEKKSKGGKFKPDEFSYEDFFEEVKDRL
ncbi:MAG: ATP-dependent helicase [Nanoarchaeota archaeon]|nr:ATP-dependent helicase [Nanoarchaeota archaeon]